MESAELCGQDRFGEGDEFEGLGFALELDEAAAEVVVAGGSVCGVLSEFFLSNFFGLRQLGEPR